LITFRVDVDYAYPSRIRSFIYTATGIKMGRDYLKNSKIAAKMINESSKEVRTYWFFTPSTIPDEEMMGLLDPAKHEVGLHIAKDPLREMSFLERSTGRKIRYYTTHGTARLLARVMWKRWKERAPKIPDKFPLQSFYVYPTVGIDKLCHIYNTKDTLRIVEGYVKRGYVLHFHPIWLFQRGRINHRGPFYDTLKTLLDVDKELKTLVFRKKFFVKMVSDEDEYEKDIVPTGQLMDELGERGADIFNFIERKWCYSIQNPSKSWARADDNVALLQVTSYDDWWKKIGKKTRNMVRKAEKSEIKTEVVEPDQRFLEGVWKIYNETPIRQERSFPYYGIPLKTVMRSILSSQNCTYISAYSEKELAGFIQLVNGKNTVRISKILSLQAYRERAVNNALVAKAVEVCAAKGVRWIMYGRMGNHPTLDEFKQNNGFTQSQLTRYYVPLTRKGRLAIKLGLHRDLKDSLPQSLKRPLFPLYNWISRTKIKVKLRLKPQQIT